jgi:hypothetical protein
MPNQAELFEKSVTTTVCRKILLAIEEGDCRTIEDVKEYINAIIEEEEKKFKR